jgi:hypothetical protein
MKLICNMYSFIRYRGWHKVQTKRGEHFVLTSPTFENSYQGRLHKKLHLRAKSQAKTVTTDFAYRYTKSSEIRKRSQVTSGRPNTAPAIMQNPAVEEPEEELTEEKDLHPTESVHTVDTGYESCDDKSLPSSKTSLTPTQAWGSEVDSIVSKSSMDSQLPVEADFEEMAVTLRSTEDYDTMQSKKMDKGHMSPTRKVQEINERAGNVCQDGAAKVIVVPKKEKISIDTVPVPQMQHSKPKVVAVGGIGKISLLESISEVQQWEDDMEEEEEKDDLDATRPKSMPDPDLHKDQGHKIADDGEERSMVDNLILLSRRLSADDGKDRKRCSRASLNMPALSIEEMIEREKQSRIRKQKKLQGSNLEKMGVAVFSTPRDRKPSMKSTSTPQLTSRSSIDSPHLQNNQPHHNPHPQNGHQSKTRNNSAPATSRSHAPASTPTKERNNSTRNTLEKNKNAKNLHQNLKNSIRNNVTSTTDYEKQNISVQGPQKNTEMNHRKSLGGSSGQNRGKYDRLLKRMEGCISDVFANKLSAARPRGK